MEFRSDKLVELAQIAKDPEAPGMGKNATPAFRGTKRQELAPIGERPRGAWDGVEFGSEYSRRKSL